MRVVRGAGEEGEERREGDCVLMLSTGFDMHV